MSLCVSQHAVVPCDWLTLFYLDGRVAPRSGLAAKHGIDTLAGVIDADYRGPVGVILANLSDADFAVKTGDRVAQLIVEKVRVLILLATAGECGVGRS